MHQLGHSRAQIMHDVQAGSINLIVPCPADGRWFDHDGRRRTRPPTVAAATSSGSASGAPGSRSPQTALSGTPGGTIRRRLGDAAVSPGSFAPGQVSAVRAASTASLRIGVPSKSGREQEPAAIAADELDAEQFGHLAFVPCRAGEEVADAVEPRPVTRKLGADQQRLRRPSPGCAAPPAPAASPRPISSTQPSHSKNAVAVRLSGGDGLAPRRGVNGDHRRPDRSTGRARPAALRAAAGSRARRRRPRATGRCPW